MAKEDDSWDLCVTLAESRLQISINALNSIDHKAHTLVGLIGIMGTILLSPFLSSHSGIVAFPPRMIVGLSLFIAGMIISIGVLLVNRRSISPNVERFSILYGSSLLIDAQRQLLSVVGQSIEHNYRQAKKKSFGLLVAMTLNNISRGK